MGYKGDWKRSSSISDEEEELRWLLLLGRITEEKFNKQLKALKKDRQ